VVTNLTPGSDGQIPIAIRIQIAISAPLEIQFELHFQKTAV